ncbi:superoxide dismutase [Sphingomonas sp. MMS24-J13]|uniref:superoxide dismutase n=1 Tax=Sphingomonas sp. MMS24-J13 TaxID=3238686 RepID=UPI00384E450B
MDDVSRRTILLTGTVLAAATAAPLEAAEGAAARPVTGLPSAAPLPFDPASLGWLSEKLIVSHHDNNYAGAVKRLGQIRGEFASIDPATAPGYRINGLKREELIAWNSMILHELYFAGLGQAGRPGSRLSQAIERDFGSHERWAAEFTGMGKALGGGSGWVLLAWSPRDQRLVNSWAADHTMTLAGSTPILALDMYEHAYALDFGAKAGDYVDGFMKSIAWGNADRLFSRVA